MAAPNVRATMTVDEVMRRWPTTIAVFRRRQMACVGCAVAPFTTIGEAAAIYGIPVDRLLTELTSAVRKERGGKRDDA